MFWQIALGVTAKFTGRRGTCSLIQHVGDETRIARIVISQHNNALPHRIVISDNCFDFSQLDTKTAEFHLVIDAIEVFQIAIRQLPDQIAGSIQVGHRCPYRSCPREISRRSVLVAQSSHALRRHHR